MLHGKKILLGITGSIAAYKSALLVRLLVKSGAEVRVIMTTSASDFISPLTLSTLSKNPVYQNFVRNEAGEWNNHVELGLWADYLLIAPASANTIAKMANGICDNLLLAVYLSARCPVAIAPAMDLDMWLHQGTQANIQKLESYGNLIIDPESGELASGLKGKGRMAEPEQLHTFLLEYFEQSNEILGKTALVTAGPTYEALDPVRFIGNHSSGKMGFALAEALAKRGAKVELVSGPSQEVATHPNVHLTRVVSAEEMYEACNKFYPNTDISIFAAAVADYRPAIKADQKIKKQEDNLKIELVKNKDIAAELGKIKQKHQINIGFALETENEEKNALEKLKKKNLDMIILNSLNDPGAGFGYDTNKVSIITLDDKISIEQKLKTSIAEDIVSSIINRFYE